MRSTRRLDCGGAVHGSEGGRMKLHPSVNNKRLGNFACQLASPTTGPIKMKIDTAFIADNYPVRKSTNSHGDDAYLHPTPFSTIINCHVAPTAETAGSKSRPPHSRGGAVSQQQQISNSPVRVKGAEAGTTKALAIAATRATSTMVRRAMVLFFVMFYGLLLVEDAD